MKIKDGFMLRKIADTFIIIPLGEKVVEFNGLMTLSESGALLWNTLQNSVSQIDLVEVLQSEYKIDKHTASADVDEFLSELTKKGLIE